MFTNLIESSSHAREFKRRGSFFLFTVVTYALLFSVAGVLSIYAYDAQLQEPASEITMLSPVDFEQVRPVQEIRSSASENTDRNTSQVAERRVAYATVDEPTIVPEKTSATAPSSPAVPPGTAYRISHRDADPASAGGPGKVPGAGTGVTSGTPVIDVGTPPPVAPPAEKPKPKVIRKTVLNGEATLLPKPVYPPIAKQMRLQGAVTIQVLVDEQGRVVSASVVNGNPMLVHAARQAALQARFSPTMLGDQPVKVSGVITYNFVLQ